MHGQIVHFSRMKLELNIGYATLKLAGGALLSIYLGIIHLKIIKKLIFVVVITISIFFNYFYFN